MRRKCVGQHDAQPQRNHRQHDGHARLFQPAVDGVKQEEQADADIKHAFDAQIVHADIQNFGFARIDEQRQQRPRKDEDQRGNDGAEGKRKQRGFANALFHAIRLARACVLRDEGRKTVGKILRGRIGERVDLHACRERRHRRDAETVDQTLHKQNAEVHDRLLHARQHADARNAAQQRTIQPKGRPARPKGRKAERKVEHNARGGKPLRDDRCQRRAGNAPVEDDHEQQIERDVHHRGEQQEQQRRKGIADAAQNRREEIIEEREENAREDHQQVAGDIRHGFLRHAEQRDERVQQRIAERHQQQRQRRDETEGVGHGGFQLLRVALAVELAEHDAAAHAQAENKAGEQDHQRKRASDGCQSDIAQKTADNQRIRDIIELLKQVARNQRQAETDQPGADGALS